MNARNKKSRRKILFCVLHDADFGNWHDHPKAYDSTHASKSKAISIPGSAVHRLNWTGKRWICTMEISAIS
jgi:hypothetical protein